MQLTFLVEGWANRRFDSASRALVGDARGNVHGRRPGSVQLQYLGAMHLTLAAERHQVGLRLAPAGQRDGPLLSAPQIEHVVAHADDGAVQDAGYDRRDLVRLDAQHDLVQVGQTVASTPAGHPARPDAQLPQSDQVIIAEALANLTGLVESAVCRL